MLKTLFGNDPIAKTCEMVTYATSQKAKLDEENREFDYTVLECNPLVSQKVYMPNSPNANPDGFVWTVCKVDALTFELSFWIGDEGYRTIENIPAYDTRDEAERVALEVSKETGRDYITSEFGKSKYVVIRSK